MKANGILKEAMEHQRFFRSFLKKHIEHMQGFLKEEKEEQNISSG